MVTDKDLLWSFHNVINIKSLWCIPETNRIVYANYTSIKMIHIAQEIPLESQKINDKLKNTISTHYWLNKKKTQWKNGQRSGAGRK